MAPCERGPPREEVAMKKAIRVEPCTGHEWPNRLGLSISFMLTQLALLIMVSLLNKNSGLLTALMLFFGTNIFINCSSELLLV